MLFIPNLVNNPFNVVECLPVVDVLRIGAGVGEPFAAVAALERFVSSVDSNMLLKHKSIKMTAKLMYSLSSVVLFGIFNTYYKKEGNLKEMYKQRE